MSRWFRHYAGMARDEKLVRVALKSGQTIERVVWVWGAILESAAEIDDDGKFEVEAGEVAYFLRADEADILRVVAALEALGRVCDGRVVKWGDRQFQSDRSAERQRRHRDRAKQADELRGDAEAPSSDGGVTAASRHGDAPETETELDTETSSSLRELGARKPKPASRGTRIAPDWSPSERNTGDAVVLGLPRAEIPREAQRFRDYWKAKAGPAGIKLDWDATWRNWVSRTCETKGYAPVAENGTGASVVWVPEDSPLWLDASTAWAAKHGHRPVPKGSKHGAGIGFHFPAEMVPAPPAGPSRLTVAEV